MFEHLREAYGGSADLVGSELVAGVGRCNYGQDNLQVNALAGGRAGGRVPGGGWAGPAEGRAACEGQRRAVERRLVGAGRCT